MTEEKPHTEITVQKHTYTYQTCYKCDGTGRESTPLRKLIFVKDCPVCSGTGRIRFAKTEDIPLHEALSEIENRTNYH